jgi:hypothetical protein
MSFRTASTVRSNSISLIARSNAPGRRSVAKTVRGTALCTYRHASLLFEGSAAVASAAKLGRNREVRLASREPRPPDHRQRPPLGPTCPMRARFGHESGEFACR